MARKTVAKGPVHLRFDDNEVLVTPKDHDRFMLAAQKAVDALRRMTETEEWLERFSEEYLPLLHSWCKEHADRVGACYLGFPSRNGALPVFVIGSSSDYDFDLGREVSALELRLEDHGWSSDVLQIPLGDENDLSTFFDPTESLQVYGQPEAAPGKG
jgi:hypothetical protein